MTARHGSQHRHGRRIFLGLAGLAAIPTAAVAVLQARAEVPPAEATTGGIDAPVKASPTPKTSATAKPLGGGPVPAHTGRTILGAYLGLDGLSDAEAVALRRRQLGRDLGIYHTFYAWTDTLPSAIPWLPADAYPMVSWRGYRYKPVLRGEFDALIVRNARALKRLGRPVLLRWGWEMNGDWYNWGGPQNGNDPSSYVRVWKYIHKIFEAEGATNVSWVWSPNWNDSPDVAANRKARYYPGDDYVDWVGVSGYNLDRELPGAMFQDIYDQYAAKKPIMITEIGSVDRGGTTKGDWITLAETWIKQHPALGAVVWFDTDTHPGYPEKWRIDSNAPSLAAFKAMAKDAHFLP